MNDFVIQYITISNGNYFFHNGNVTKRLDDISKEQLTKYFEYLSKQIKQCETIIIIKK